MNCYELVHSFLGGFLRGLDSFQDTHECSDGIADLDVHELHLLVQRLFKLRIDQSELFRGTVVKKDRSLMNAPFVLPTKELDEKFIKEAKEHGFENLKGHRTVGGMRASMYNAMPIEGVEKLVEFMKKFEMENK